MKIMLIISKPAPATAATTAISKTSSRKNGSATTATTDNASITTSN